MRDLFFAGTREGAVFCYVYAEAFFRVEIVLKDILLWVELVETVRLFGFALH